MEIKDFKIIIREKFSNSGKTRTLKKIALSVINGKTYSILIDEKDESTINTNKRGIYNDKIISTDISSEFYQKLIDKATEEEEERILYLKKEEERKKQENERIKLANKDLEENPEIIFKVKRISTNTIFCQILEINGKLAFAKFSHDYGHGYIQEYFNICGISSFEILKKDEFKSRNCYRFRLSNGYAETNTDCIDTSSGWIVFLDENQKMIRGLCEDDFDDIIQLTDLNL